MLAAVTLGAVFALFSGSSARAAFGFKEVSQALVEEDSAPARQAGSHPYAWTAAFALNATGSGVEELPEGALKDLRIELPPGLVGAPGLLPHCSRAEFGTESCPGSAEVGTIELDTALTRGLPFPVYNLEPLAGSAAELGFVAQLLPMTIAVRLAPRPPYNLVAELPDAPQAAAFFGTTLTIRGVPGGEPFLTLPRSCAPVFGGFEADAWEAPDAWVSAAPPEPLQPTGCERLGFSPELAVTPTTTAAEAPSGLDVALDLPNPGLTSATGTANADLAGAALELPPQMTINPAVATLLAACSPAQLAAETPDSASGQGCPQAAKVGTAEVTTPLLDRPLAGTIYVATPDDPATAAPGAEDRFDARYVLYLVLRDPERGVLITIPMRLDPDPADGRLRATIPDLPQLPFTHLELHFNSGPRAPLTTPPCGSRTLAYSLTPSSGAAPTTGTQSLTIDRECAVPSFHPTLSAGTASTAAGSAAPFVVDLAGSPGEPNLAAVALSLPPGLGAALGTVPTCPETAAPTGACPPGSRLGYARIAVGPGPEPLWIPERGHRDSAVYLAGPDRGAPYSLSIAVPAQAGPFDLGTVVLRAPIRIDPRTAQASLAIAGLPQIIGGVPLQYRRLRLVLDRPGFIRNPTSCEPSRIAGSATAADGATAELGARFQAADCAALPFRPRLALRLSGGLGRNAHPGLRAVLRGAPGEAAVAGAGFDLPAGELLDVRRLGALCARDLAVADCPADSQIGSVAVRSPLLAQPLRGPVFLRAPSRRYPDLLAEVEGGGVRLVLHGRTGATRAGRLRFRLVGLPDLPLSRAEIALPGRRGIVVNSTDLCGRRLRADALLNGQNGKQRRLRPRVRLDTPC